LIATDISTINKLDPPPMDPKPNSVHETSLNVEGKDGDEGEERPPEASERRLSLRRNSISLPNLDDLQVLKQHVQIAEDGDDDTDSDYEIPPTSR
jgi:hypothetical protein